VDCSAVHELRAAHCSRVIFFTYVIELEKLPCIVQYYSAVQMF